MRFQHIHGLRLVDRGTADFLAGSGRCAGSVGRQLDGLADLRGFIEGRDDSHILQALVARRLGIAPFEHAPREINQLGGELVAFGRLSFASSARRS